MDDKMVEFAKKCFKNNKAVNGWWDYQDGDIMAPLNAEDMYGKPNITDNLAELYEWCKRYDGTFIWKNIVIFNSTWNFGTFVYVYPDYKHYKEHLTMSAINIDEFMDIIRKLSEGTYWES